MSLREIGVLRAGHDHRVGHATRSLYRVLRCLGASGRPDGLYCGRSSAATVAPVAASRSDLARALSLYNQRRFDQAIEAADGRPEVAGNPGCRRGRARPGPPRTLPGKRGPGRPQRRPGSARRGPRGRPRAARAPRVPARARPGPVPGGRVRGRRATFRQRGDAGACPGPVPGRRAGGLVGERGRAAGRPAPTRRAEGALPRRSPRTCAPSRPTTRKARQRPTGWPPRCAAPATRWARGMPPRPGGCARGSPAPALPASAPTSTSSCCRASSPTACGSGRRSDRTAAESQLRADWELVKERWR